MTYEEIFERCKRVLNSCETRLQLDNGKKYCFMLTNKYLNTKKKLCIDWYVTNFESIKNFKMNMEFKWGNIKINIIVD